MSNRALSDTDIEHFMERGYVRVEAAFPHEAALRAQDDVWEQLARWGVQKSDPATWTQPMVHLQETFDTPAFRACKTQRLKDTVEDLLGEGRWRTRETNDGWGWWPVNFAVGADRPWDVPAAGWHWDGQHFRHYVNAPDQGLLLLCIFSDIRSQGGATLIAEGSHKVVARFLSGHPDGVELVDGIRECLTSHPWLADLADRPISPAVCYDRERFAQWQQSGDRIARFMNRAFVDDAGFYLQVVEATASAGDIFVCHPFLFHCQSQNSVRVPRFLCNRTTPLFEPLQLNRPDGNFSLLEISIRRVLTAA